MTERERSDWFWSRVTHFGAYGFTYESLAEITADAHLVVRGRVIGRQDGQLELFDGTVTDVQWGVVSVDEVLKGSPQGKTPGAILVEDLGNVEATVDLPNGDVILFLKNYAQLRVDEGSAPSSDADDRYYYGRPNGYQCVLRNLDGQVGVPKPFNWNGDLGPFLARIDGQPFDDVVNRVRAMAVDSE